MELAAVWIAGALALAAIAVVWRSSPRTSWLARVALVVAMIAGAAVFARPYPRASAARGPRVTHDSAYVGSGACRACHPSEHASWSRTYHRTMTRRATPEAMLAKPESALPIVLLTGSHHMQGYWTEDERGVLRMLPVVYALDEKRLIPRSEAFLEPENAPQHDVRWTSNCIACHATSGRPHLDAPGSRSSAAELGIACEACHGPGADHVAREHDPFTRWRRVSASIVNPAKLPPDRASAVCGQCHAYAFPRDEDSFFASGYADAFHPGDALEPSRILLTPAVLGKQVFVDTDSRNLFWPDGTVRVGGREYNAMVLSACYLRGEGERKITCLTCHSMHASDPDDQLRRGLRSEAETSEGWGARGAQSLEREKDRSVQDACVSCHKMAPDHSHHAAGSPGSACVACHMPKTSYALRTAIRSHRIDSPTIQTAKPNACNLCHLDRSVSWAARETARLWKTLRASADVDDALPASAYGLLGADAAERVIWASAFGDPDALAASGRDWERPLLEAAEKDPYAVIRYIASRSKKSLGPAARVVVPKESIDLLVLHRDNREVYVAE